MDKPLTDGIFRWWWGRGHAPDEYRGGFRDHEDAVAVAEYAMREEGERDYTLVLADSHLLETDVFDGERILEELEERNEECCGEDGLGIDVDMSALRELERALADTLKVWLTRHHDLRRHSPFGVVARTEHRSLATPYEAASAPDAISVEDAA